jgi:urea transporter/murein DD-endopeptidase MepM/ murein hydrolase activator NlpD
MTKSKLLDSIKLLPDSTIKGYSAIFFSESRLLGLLLLMVSFLDIKAGFCGVLAVFISNILALMLGFDKYKLKNGYYAFNSLLVGIGLGHTYQVSSILILIIIIASMLTLFLTISIENILKKYGLPYLSIPFVLCMWIVFLATRHFNYIQFNEKDIFLTNQLFSLGGSWLVKIYSDLDHLPISQSLKFYFLSLGAIFFQANLIAGILISIGLLFFSRIAFSLSLIGFYSAYLFYQFTGTDVSSLGYNFIGYNFILTSIAIGSYFLIPSFYSYFWSAFILPVAVLISLSSSSIFNYFQLPIFALPFNFVVLLFLYVIKSRIYPSLKLSEVAVQHNMPEKNLYFFKNSIQRFSEFYHFPISLPFIGFWRVTQGHNGELTHKGDWCHAWDFEKFDEDNKSYYNEGNDVSDYYCYNSPILAPANGFVIEIIDDVDDNKIGEANLVENWGNEIVIKHSEYLYSKISHVKLNSFKVAIGDYVKKGDILGLVGNSGRSPYPHLHFQLQATPYVGSKTLSYPISQYISKNDKDYELNSFDIPNKDEDISNLQINQIIQKALKFVAGQKIKMIEVLGNPNKELEWTLCNDIYNNTYFQSSQSNALAYYLNDGGAFYFKNYIGEKTDYLYYLFLALYKIPICFYKDMKITDDFPIHLIMPKCILFFQDFLAPFIVLLKSKYTLVCYNIDDEISPNEIVLKATIENSIFNYKFSIINIEITLNTKGLDKIEIIKKNKRTELKCIKN